MKKWEYQPNGKKLNLTSHELSDLCETEYVSSKFDIRLVRP